MDYVQLPSTDFLPKQRDRIFTLILAGACAGQLSTSIFIPFFPMEADAKDVHPTLVGWIFGIFQLTTLVFTPCASRLLVRFGPKRLLVFGNLLGGTANALLGFGPYTEGRIFAGGCFMLRALGGIAASLLSTAGYSMLSPLFGPNVSTAAGTLEGASALAMILGPLVGSGLFVLGGGAEGMGYVMPFLVLGLGELIFAVMSCLLLPRLPPSAVASQPSLVNFAPNVILAVTGCLVVCTTTGMVMMTFAAAAAEVGYHEATVGVAFAFLSLVYASSANLAGRIDDLFEGRYGSALMLVGALLLIVAFFTLGPLGINIGTYAIQLAPSPLLFWIGTVFLGCGVAFGFIPLYKQFRTSALHSCEEERDVAASSAFTMAVATGSFLGPVTAGPLSELVGVQGTYTLAGMLELIFIVLMLPMLPMLRKTSQMPP